MLLAPGSLAVLARLVRLRPAPARISSRWESARPFVYLALPFFFYLVPVAAGFAWNALDPYVPKPTGMKPYQGRLPDACFAVEWYGTGVVGVPFQARLREYLLAGELPLWNPYQGLGQPFAAQGEGCPYSPLAIARALAPSNLGNLITFAAIYMSAVCLFLFLRGLGLAEGAALFGSMTWTLSGALTLHLARPILCDQVAMYPIWFWATARAMRLQSGRANAVLGLATALHILAGFAQIALTTLLLLTPFVLLYGRLLHETTRDWLRCVGGVFLVLILGNALGAFHLLPMAEAMRTLQNKNPEQLGFLALPYANLLSFCFPHLFGQLFMNWVPGCNADAPDWNNLFAYGSAALLLLNVMGWCLLRGQERLPRALFMFFSLAALFLMLRYVSFPPVAAVNLLPGVGRQSPKHATGGMAFCLVVAASFAAQRLRAVPEQRTRWWVGAVLATVVLSTLVHVRQRGGWNSVNAPMALNYLSFNVALGVVLLTGLWLARRWQRLTGPDACVLITTLAVAELSCYLPLGNASSGFLWCRLAIFAALALAGLLLALRIWLGAGVLFAGAGVAYALLVVLPEKGLPERYAIDKPGKSLNWLHAQVGQEYRVFGIAPDFSSLASVQDIGVVGPLAPTEYLRFVETASSQKMADFYRSSSTFWITPDSHNVGTCYDLEDYGRARPIFDWLGVRYLVLDQGVFGAGKPRHESYVGFRGRTPETCLAYQDALVDVVESRRVHGKVIFAPTVSTYPDQAAVLTALREEPSRILGPPLLEGVDAGLIPALDPSAGPTQPASITSYRPNSVLIHVDAPTAGLLVVKDCYAPGWRAYVNGAETPIVRVNGMVRGVALHPGRHDVEFRYLPASFVVGALLAGVAACWFGLAAIVGRRGTLPRWALLAGAVLAALLLDLTVQAYFGASALSWLTNS